MLLSKGASDKLFFCPSLLALRALVDMGIHKMPEPSPPEKECWPIEAISPLLEGLSKADWERLNRAAAYRCNIVSINPDELLQEALIRTLSGERRCPKDINILTFLRQTMRSIASSDAKSFSKNPGSVQLSDFEEHTYLQSATQEKATSIEDKLCSEDEAKEIKENILALFEHDETATMILMGRIEEMNASEIQKMLKIDQTQYQSKTKYIRRTINKHFPNGWK